jgi:chromosome segregation protein
MKIKNLELFGFKSFVDRTVFEFPTGITAIVGPNGCGKSNLVDAIRWCMGEMSAKHLRGKSMEDVIFNGSQKRPPVNMAEVTLTFSTDDGIVPSQYASLPEISVARRVFRNMESEYLINKVPCRLRDVLELFMDTGVGTKAYAIVEQGQIADLVSARPADRRILIEDAAGITKYKSRKNAALRKLDSTQQNLLRVNDIVHEVRRQMGSLERQARRAERYKALRDELRTLELDLAARQARALERESGDKKKVLADLRLEHETASASIATEEAAAESLRLELTESERSVEQEQAQLYEFKASIAQNESQMNLLKKDRENIELQRRRGLAEFDRLGGERVRLEVERSGVQKECDAVREARKAKEGALAESEALLVQVVAREASMAEELGQENERLVNTVADLARAEKSLEDLGRRRAEAQERTEGGERALAEARSRLEAMDSELAAARARLTEAHAARTRTDSEMREAARRLEALSQEVSASERAWRETRDQFQEATSRLESLRELESHYEGYQEGVRSILVRSKSEPERRHKVMGLLAEVIDAPREYERAVEAALGERLQYVLVKDLETAVDGINFLKRSSSGRSSFLPLSMRDAGGADGAVPDPVLAPPLLDAIRVKEPYRRVVKSLLRGVHVVDTLDRATAIWRANDFQGTLVTREGDLVDRLGVMTGGSESAAGGGLFARKREIEELAGRHEKIRAACARAEAAFGARRADLEATQRAVEGLGRELHEAEIGKVSIEQAVARLESERDVVIRTIAGQEAEAGSAAEASAEAGRTLEEVIGRQRALAEARTRGEAEIASLRERRASLLADLEGARLEATELKVETAGLAEREQRFEQESSRLGQAILETDGRLSEVREEVDGGTRRLAEIEEALKKTQAALDRLVREHTEAAEALTGKRDALQVDSGRLQENVDRLREMRHRHQGVGEEIGKLQVGETETNLRLQHLSDAIFDKYHVRVEDLEVDETVTLDHAAREERQNELKEQIERLGEVNVTAIEEYQELSERYRFLTEQSEDLRRTMESLQNAIQKINRTSRKLFVETFEQVSAKFEVTFPRLFNGGKARLSLTEGEDVLEAGVEIVAQPPGKRLQNVTLLSGGEKTLTAVSLLFAIFQVKPSPFFLLDEVDAALDDANVGRFNTLLHEMTARSQFVLITHNKATIELSDTLYGVTMEEPGISKVVSVKLN